MVCHQHCRLLYRQISTFHHVLFSSSSSSSASSSSPSLHSSLSSHARGLQYESYVQTLLTLHLNGRVSLVRCGGPADRGIDLRGTWTPEKVGKDDEKGMIHLAVQCKYESRPLPVSTIRTFEAALQHHFREERFPLQARKSPNEDEVKDGRRALGMLVSHQRLSSESIRLLAHVSVPLAVAVAPLDTGKIHSWLLSRPAEELFPQLTISTVRQSPSEKWSVLRYYADS